MRRWQTTAERLVRSVAPDDMGGTPIYLVDGHEAEAFDPLLARPEYNAWTSRVCDLQVAEMLVDSGRWSGRGFAAVVYPERCGSMPKLLGTAMHELAHHLAFGEQLPATPDEAVASSRVLRSWLSDPLPPSSDYPPEQLPPWSGHGAAFVRASSHLAYRAGRLVESVRPKHLSFAAAYYMPPFNEAAFMDALSGELGRSGSIRSILAEPAPRAFRDRWAAATHDWFEAQNGTTN